MGSEMCIRDRASTLCSDPVKNFVYIDDFNSLERLRLTNAPSHITVQKREVKLHAEKTEKLFGEIKELASDIGMRVNNKKHSCYVSMVINMMKLGLFINADDNRIVSTDS